MATKAQIKEHRPDLVDASKKHGELQKNIFNLIEEYKSIKRMDRKMDADDIDGFVEFIIDEIVKIQK